MIIYVLAAMLLVVGLTGVVLQLAAAVADNVDKRGIDADES